MAKSASKFTAPFSIGYAYAQTQHYRDTVAAQRQESSAADPFDGVEIPEEPAVAEVPAVPAQRKASDAAVRYALSLTAQKLGTSGEDLEAVEKALRTLSPREVSKTIDTLKPMANYKAPAAAQVEEGMYRDPATGDIYKVQVAHHGSGRLYAKKLVALDVPRVKRGKEHSHDFEYAPGAVNRIQLAWRMTREKAAEWGRLYGSCCKCGTILTDEKSIAAGIGPICAEGF